LRSDLEGLERSLAQRHSNNTQEIQALKQEVQVISERVAEIRVVLINLQRGINLQRERSAGN
jgi:hypothetical protein